MGHSHPVYDRDTHFTINAITRAIKNDGLKKTALVQHDHNSERFTFVCPRYIEDHDLSECNKVEVHYLNINTTTKKQHSGLYEVSDLRVNPDDEETVICTWLISRNATDLNGKVNFLLRYACIENGVIRYAWHTLPASVDVATGMDASGMFESEYVDVIERWKESVMRHFTDGLNAWKAEAQDDLTAWKDSTGKAVREEAFADILVERQRIDYLSNYVTPQMFGAVGDGVTDDTEALQNCFDTASKNGILCKIPHGVYCFQNLAIKNNIAVEGVDKTLAKLKHIGSGCAITIKPENASSWLTFPRVALKNVSIAGNENSDVGIRVSECIHSVFESIFVENCKIGFFIDGSSDVQSNKNSVFNNEYKSISIVNCKEIALKIDGIISDSHFENLYAENCPVCADMDSVSTHNVSFTDGSFIICEKGFYIHGLFNNVRIETFNIEQFSSHGIHIVSDGTNQCKNFTIANCLFFGNQETSLCVEGSKFCNSVIWNNNALGSSATHVKLAKGCLGVMLMNNNKNNSAESSFVTDIPATCFAVNYVYDKQDAFTLSTPLKLDKTIVNNVTLVDGSGGHSEIKLFDAYSIVVKRGGYHTYILPALTSEERLALSAPRNGSCVFDTTLGKPVWRAGDAYWVDATGERIY